MFMKFTWYSEDVGLVLIYFVELFRVYNMFIVRGVHLCAQVNQGFSFLSCVITFLRSCVIMFVKFTVLFRFLISSLLIFLLV